jgi:hypothetical protein
MDRPTVELKRIWKEAVLSHSRHLPAIGLEAPRISAQNVNQVSGCSIRHSTIAKRNTKLQHYKSNTKLEANKFVQ